MSPRAYAGRGLPVLPPARTQAATAVPVPGKLDATLLPDPRATFAALRDKFIAARGVVNASRPAAQQDARLTIADVRVIANFVSFALRNDLSTIDPHDAAVIWEKWRKAIGDMRDMMHNVENDAQALIVATVLGHRTWDIAECMATAQASPLEVFQNYCPWRADWATDVRIYPERDRFTRSW